MIIFSHHDCAKKDEAYLFRFIDHIGQKNVVASPLKTASAESAEKIPKDSSLAEIADQYPLLEMGIRSG